MKASPSSVVGNKVMVVIKISACFDFGVRVERRVTRHKRPYDDRFKVLAEINDELDWWICSTEQSKESEAVARAVKDLMGAGHIQLVQIVDGYLVTSCLSMYKRPENYTNAWEETDRLHKSLQTARMID